MAREFLTKTATWLLVSLLALSVPLPTWSDQARYFYDELGRVIGVVDGSGNVVVYQYDPVGNLLSIQRYTPGTSVVGLFLLAPTSATVGGARERDGRVDRVRQRQCDSARGPDPRRDGHPVGAGLIRFEAFALTFTGTSTPAAAVSLTPGPVTAASTPALGSPPTLTISAVASIAAPSTPTGSYTTADVSLPTGTTNPVTVTLMTANIPVGTTFTVRVVPQFGFSSLVTSTATAGTFANATATASVTFPVGQVSVLNAYGSFTLPQLARLFPPIDGSQ